MGPLIGAQLDNYRIVEKLGEGGMGSVYRAVDVMLERDVALKFLRPELSREPELVQRFRAEAVLLARLNHHFIAPIFGLHRYGEELFIAMEYVPGETLDARLKRLDKFSPDAALHITSMVLQALDYAHRLGVVHRDIKPGNVILTPAGTAKVMDFGIARVIGAERRTRAGAIVGTISYMAPEQIQGHDTDQRADLYSVGTLLYEMLSGHVPFQADTDWALMQAHIAHVPPPLRGEVDVPEALETAVLKSLEKAPERRYQSASEFQHALERVAREGDSGQFVEASHMRQDPSRGAPLTGGPGVTSWEETRLGIPTPLPGTIVSPPDTWPPSASPGSAPGVSPPPPSDLTTLSPATPVPPGTPPPAPSPSQSSPGVTMPRGASAPGSGWASQTPAAPALPVTPPTSGRSPYPWAAPTVSDSAASPPGAPTPTDSAQQPLVSGIPASARPGAQPARVAKSKAPSAKKPMAIGAAAGALIAVIVAAGIGWAIWRAQQPPTEIAPTPPVDSASQFPPAQPSDGSAVAPGSPAAPAGSTPSGAAAPGAGSTSTPPTPGTPGTAAAPAPTTKPRPGTMPTDVAGTPGTATAKPGAPTATPAPSGQLSETPLPAPAAPLERPPTVAPEPPPSKAPEPAGNVAGPVFRNVRIVRPKGPELEAELHFGSAQLEVTNAGGRNKLHALDYSSIASAEYQEARQMRVIVRTTRYWLLLRGSAGWELRLRLERDNTKPIIEALEQRWGRKVTSTEAPESERP